MFWGYAQKIQNIPLKTVEHLILRQKWTLFYHMSCDILDLGKPVLGMLCFCLLRAFKHGPDPETLHQNPSGLLITGRNGQIQTPALGQHPISRIQPQALHPGL